MKYKLVVADFDDTTVGDDLVISKENEIAIHDYVAKGGVFAFCTGRMIQGIIKYARDLKLRGEIIGYQGAEVADIETGRVKYRYKIPYETALMISKFLDKHGWYYQIYDDGKFYVEKDTDIARHYEFFTGVKMNVAGTILSEFIYINKISPVKIMLRVNENERENIMKTLNDNFSSLVKINFSKKYLIEIVDINVDKGIAVKEMANRLGIEKEEIICIGDALSDVPMIKFAGLGVCVANGCQEAKESADILAPSCKENGLAYVLNKFGYID